MKSRNAEEVERFMENLPLMRMVCQFPVITDNATPEEFLRVVEKRLDRIRAVHDLIENWKRKL